MMVEICDEDRAALRAVYRFASEALALARSDPPRIAAIEPVTGAPSRNIITLALGLAILDRLTDTDEEGTS
jgi:hypothetical protein